MGQFKKNLRKVQKEKPETEFVFGEPKERLAQSPYSTSWLTVYSKFWLVMMAAIVVAMLTVTCFQSNNYSQIMQSDVSVAYKFMFTAAMLISVFIIGLAIYLYAAFKELTMKCFLWNKVFLILYPVAHGWGKSLELVGEYKGDLWLYVLLLSLGAALFTAFNLVYFEHRRYLFDESVKPKQGSIKNALLKDLGLTLCAVLIATLVCYLCFDRVLM